MITLCQPYRIDRSLLRKWFVFIALAKCLWFVAFVALRSEDWASNATIGGIAFYPNESYSYYLPIENLLAHGQYTSVCRMPGLLPFYAPLRFFLSEIAAKQCMVILQVILDVFATLSLGLLVARIFQSIKALHITLLISCISSFTAVRNNFLLSDSLCISISVLSIYSFSSFLINPRFKNLLLTALGLCTAVFLRPALIVVLPVISVLLVAHLGLSRRSIGWCAVLILPTVCALSLWTLHNRITDGRAIVFVAPLGECQPQITPDFAAIRKWIIATGGDYQPWAKGGESYWFFDSSEFRPMPFQADDFATAYDSTLLLTLKSDYHLLHSGSLSNSDSLQLEKSIINRAQTCYDSYVAEHPYKFFVFNRLKFLQMILFPHRIDDLPFPAYHEMNWIQKIIKMGSLAAIPFISFISVIATLFWIAKRKWRYVLWMAIPMGLVCAHAAIGFVEQRYLATSYPFLVMLIAGFFLDLRKNALMDVVSMR